MKTAPLFLFVLALTAGCVTGDFDAPPEQSSTPTATTNQAKYAERWECTQSKYTNEILVVATVEEGRESGTVAVAGVTHKAHFKVAGFNRRWDFGPVEHPGRYAFLIEPDGD